MRCKACNNALSDRESSRKGLFTGEYLDLCTGCVDSIPDFEYVENPAASDTVLVQEVDVEFNNEEENA